MKVTPLRPVGKKDSLDDMLDADGSALAASELYPRSPVSAERTTLRIMSDVMAMNPYRVDIKRFQLPRARRALAIFAAAAALVFASSYITALYVGKRDVVRLTFALVAPDARSVSIAGDFNDWSVDADLLEKNAKDGMWRVMLRLQKGRAYSYNFVIDGTVWVPDPRAPFSLDDGLGSVVSSLVL